MWFLRLLLLLLASHRWGLAAPSPLPAAPVGTLCLSSSCFALFWGPRSFREAGAACEEGGGHLMTVRSTVAADAIAVLLREQAGRAWLGLRLPENSCADPAKTLRGFQWVGGDESTDHKAWAGDWNVTAGVCGPRCVVVNQEQAWEERACDASADGFLCEYSYLSGTCVPLQLPADTVVTYVLPFGNRENDLTALPPDTIAQVTSLDTSLECRVLSNGSLGWDSLSSGAWNCQLANGGCDGHCLWNDQGKPFCSCPEGSTLLEENKRSCSSACGTLGCQHHCEPQGSSGVCMCFQGFVLDADGRTCNDVDDCKAEPGPCEQRCVNTQGGFECQCFEDYELVNSACLEKGWQCTELQCEHVCKAVNGTYKCTCLEPYAPDPKSPNKCVLFCNTTRCPSLCDPHSGFSCLCADGYIWEEVDGTNLCSDINECDSNVCGELDCVNTLGSFHCICPDGQVCKVPTQEPEQSGETEIPGTESSPKVSLSTLVPPTVSSNQGMLVAIIVSAVFTVIILLIVLFYLVKRYYTGQPKMDYKCQQSETGVALHHVSPSTASLRDKM